MSNEINTPETLADGADVTPSDGQGNDAVSIHEILSEITGRTFKDDNSAIKAVKDTFSYVGEYPKVKPLIEKMGGPDAFLKKMEETNQPQPAQPSPDLSDKLASLEKTVREQSFYSQNPDYAPYKEVIDSMGSDPEAVVKSESFQRVYEKLKVADQVEKSKSVLHTNPRLGQAEDKMTQARQASTEGRSGEAATLAVASVIEAYELGGK